MIQLDTAFQEAPWITPKNQHVRSAGEYQPKETHRSLFEILSERHQRDVCRAQDILAFTSAVSTVLSLGGGKGRVARPGRPGRPALPLHLLGLAHGQLSIPNTSIIGQMSEPMTWETMYLCFGVRLGMVQDFLCLTV